MLLMNEHDVVDSRPGCQSLSELDDDDRGYSHGTRSMYVCPTTVCNTVNSSFVVVDRLESNCR